VVQKTKYSLVVDEIFLRRKGLQNEFTKLFNYENFQYIVLCFDDNHVLSKVQGTVSDQLTVNVIDELEV
jgi:hypothetical protein